MTHTNVAHAPTARAWASLIGLGLIWGFSFTTTGLAVAEIGPLSVAGARLVIGAAALTVLALALRAPFPAFDGEGARVWMFAAAIAVAANALPFVLLAWAQTHVSSGLAGVYMASLPLIVLPLAARFVPGERLTWRKGLGFVVGFAGVVWLIGPSAMRLGDGGGSAVGLLAQGACLAAASGYAIGSIVTKRAPSTHPAAFGAMAIGLAAAITAPVAFLVEAPNPTIWPLHAQLALLFLGLGPTALAMLLLLDVLRRTGPSFLSLVNYQVPIWAMLFGVAFLNEALNPRAPTALAAILLGVALSQGADRRLLGLMSQSNRRRP